MGRSAQLRWAVAGLALVAVTAAALVGWQTPAPSGTGVGLLRPDDAALVQRGGQLYRSLCASCHGANLEGQANWRERGPDGRLPAPPHDESGHTWHHPDEVLLRLVRDGVAQVAGLPDYATNMPVYDRTLSDDDIVAVLSWIKSRWAPEIRARHDEINRRAQAQALR